jgi:hypothetical protein
MRADWPVGHGEATLTSNYRTLGPPEDLSAEARSWSRRWPNCTEFCPLTSFAHTAQGRTLRQPIVEKFNFWTKLAKPHGRSLKCSSNVSSRRTIWRLLLPVALLALLIGTTAGVIWHHHASSSSDNCPICHLNHQAIEPALASARVSILIATGPAPEPKRLRFTEANSTRHVPARAPPA